MHATFRLIVSLFLAAAPAAFPAAAAAMPVTVSGVSLDLPAPPGMCFLHAAYPVDRELLERTEKVMAGSNELVAGFAACTELRRARVDGTALTNYGQYLRPSPPGAPRTFAVSRAEFVRAMAAQLAGNGLRESFATAVKKLAESKVKATAVPTGMLHSDSEAVFFGGLMRYEGASEASSVSGMTLVRRVAISINLYAPSATQATGEMLLRQQIANIQALLRANP